MAALICTQSLPTPNRCAVTSLLHGVAGLAGLVNQQPSTHTMSLATLDTHMAHFTGGAKTLFHVIQFHLRSTVRRQRFEAYIRRQRALHRAAQ